MAHTWVALVGLVACQRHDPELSTRPEDCAAIVTKVRSLVASNTGQIGSDAGRVIEKMLPALADSCEHDGWPADVKQCILQAPPGNESAMDRCSKLMPKALQDSLQRRMMDANR